MSAPKSGSTVVLVCMPSDEGVAATVVNALTSQGVAVFVAHKWADVEKSQYFVPVLILWTKQSLRSADVYEIARICTNDYKVFLLAPDVAAEEIPLPLKLRPRIRVASVNDDILEILRSWREWDAMRPMFALARVEPTDAELARERQETESVRVAAGKLIYAIPPRMFVRESEEIEIRIGRDGVPRLYDDTVGRAVPTIESLPTVELMSVRIRGKPTEFHIASMSPKTQLIGGPYVDGFGPAQREFGEWHFEITPIKSGVRTLFIEVAGEVHGENGLAGSRRLEPREYSIDVRVSARLQLRRGMRLAVGLGGAAITGLIGAITQEIWWPHVRALLAAMFGH